MQPCTDRYHSLYSKPKYYPGLICFDPSNQDFQPCFVPPPTLKEGVLLNPPKSSSSFLLLPNFPNRTKTGFGVSIALHFRLMHTLTDPMALYASSPSSSSSSSSSSESLIHDESDDQYQILN